ncbi:MAG: T9SS type A sorting domain-containing protein [Paludibacter sp.]|nr:T9SS type A sorting domain-containing protein [Paludibacter sp.]
MKHLRFSLFSILLVFVFSLQAKTIRYVKVDGTGDGSSWTNASNCIQTMIDNSVSGDEVWVAKGTYYPTTETIARDARSRTFLLRQGVNMYGGFSGSENAVSQRALADLNLDGKVDSCELLNTTLLSGDIDGVPDVWTRTIKTDSTWTWSVTGNQGNVYCVVTSQNGHVNTKFDGYSITGGNANGTDFLIKCGGGMSVMANSLINNCIVYYCAAYHGGGIDATPYLSGSSTSSNAINVKINNCLIKNCSAEKYGGGIYSDYGLNMARCNVIGCSSSDYGGGVYLDNQSYNSSITDCVVNQCSAKINGGGIYSNSYSRIGNICVYLTNCYVTNCYSSNGGGINAKNDYYPSDYNKSHTFITSCFVGNCKAINVGGGIYFANENSSSNLYSYIMNCTVVNCNATNGGGIYSNFGFLENNIVCNCLATTKGSGIYSSLDNTSSAYFSNNCIINNDIYLGVGSQQNTVSPDIKTTFIKPTSFVGIANSNANNTEFKSSDWRLRENSICINAGISTDIPAYILISNDLQGNLRKLYGSVDLGAFEFDVPDLFIPVNESFNNWIDFNTGGSAFYHSTKLNTQNDIKWTIVNQKADFSWQSNLTSPYSQPIFTYQIDGTKSSKVYLRYDMYFQAYAGTISPLGTEKLNVEFSTDLVTWSTIATYSNANGTIANKTYKHDISALAAGKTFFIRFNANGANSNRIEKWEIDNVIIDADGLSAVNTVQADKYTYKLNNGNLVISNLCQLSTIQIFDINGKMLAQKVDSQTANFTLPVHGVYIVKVTSDSGIENKKVVW